MIKRFIVWYLKRHNVMFHYGSYVVRMFSDGYYEQVMANHNAVERGILINPNIQLKTTHPTEKGGAE